MKKNIGVECEYDFDEIDLRLLSELQQESSRPLYEIANALEMPIASCARRVKRLEQIGAIQRYVALLDPKMLGFDLDVFIRIHLSNHIGQSRAEFSKFVLTLPEVVECHALTGNADFLIHVRTRNVKKFDEWMRNKLMQFPYISTTHSDISLECVTYNTALPLEQDKSSENIQPKNKSEAQVSIKKAAPKRQSAPRVGKIRKK